MNTVDYKTIKKIEGETLRTFREEIPSIYFSDKTEKRVPRVQKQRRSYLS